MSNPTAFIDTHQYRLFAEFCDACAQYKYIGICYGPPGVGKTLSAMHYAKWDKLSKIQFQPSNSNYYDYIEAKEAVDITTVFYTPSVAINARTVYREINAIRERIRVASAKMVHFNLAREKLLIHAQIKRKNEKAQHIVSLVGNDRGLPQHPSCAEYETSPTVYEIQQESMKLRGKIEDPTKLIIIDESERLGAASLEQVRCIYDEGGVGLVLIGMPGLEKRLARYAQLSSRVGFVHKFNPLSAKQVRQVWNELWPAYSPSKKHSISDDAMTAIIRTTHGNFRSLERLLSQIGRVLQINNLSDITLEVVEVSRENLVIGGV